MKHKVEKGQKVWVWRQQGGITETIVTSVGRKYIQVQHSRSKFRIEDLVEQDGVGYSSFLILDIEKYKHDKYYQNLRSKLHRFDKWDKISERNLAVIKDILKEYLE
jgi:hypothetical protein